MSWRRFSRRRRGRCGPRSSPTRARRASRPPRAFCEGGRMRKLLVPFLVGVVALGGCSSRKNPDEVMTELVAVLNETAAVLATVNDAASAEAAKPKLEELAVRFRALREKFSKAVAEG